MHSCSTEHSGLDDIITSTNSDELALIVDSIPDETEHTYGGKDDEGKEKR